MYGMSELVEEGDSVCDNENEGKINAENRNKKGFPYHRASLMLGVRQSVWPDLQPWLPLGSAWSHLP